MAAEPASAAAAGSGELPELPLFGCKEAYVYKVPPAGTSGHRAELWNVNKWLATVAIKVVQADDDAYVRLLDSESGELFAECPVPTDKPLVTAVEPVVDSSRYYVLQIVDRDSQRHAFIGIGFRDRSEASDFNAALHEYLQYIKRKRTAEAMKSAYEQRERAASTGEGPSDGGEPGSALASLPDLTLKEGETLKLKIASKPAAGSGGFVSGAARRGLLNKTFSLLMDGHGGTVAGLSQSQRGAAQVDDIMSVSPNPHRLSGAGDLQQRLAAMRLAEQQQQQQQGAAGSPSVAAAVAAAAAGQDEEEDDFGEFEAAPPSPASAAGADGAGAEARPSTAASAGG